MEKTNYVVAIYLVEMAYGGPEEGGWWYDTGDLVRLVRVFRCEGPAYEYANRLNNKLRSKQFGPNKGKREKSSVASNGVYEAYVYEDTAPRMFPAVRPHYE